MLKMMRAGSTLVVLLSTLALSSPAAAQGEFDYDPNVMREVINRGTVMIQGGKQDSAFTRLASDIATVVDSDEIRVLALMGKGSYQNVQDLMFLSGVDASFTQADTLKFYADLQILPNLDRDLRYIMRTSDEEFHLLASSNINDIRDLEGKKVNFGRNGTGTFTTSSVVFDRLGISVEATSFPHKKALALLKKGELSAMAKVDGKPVGIVAEATIDDGVKLLDVPYEELSEIYIEASLSHGDYPNLFAQGDQVDTIAVPSLLAVYNFPADNPRAAKVDRFIRALFGKIEEVKDAEAGGDEKWSEIDLNDEVPGWQRHPTAEALLRLTQ